MIKTYQVTLYNADGRYKPVSCLLKHEEGDLKDTTFRKSILKLGTEKICMKKYWTKNDLLRYNYLKCKCREYEVK